MLENMFAVISLIVFKLKILATYLTLPMHVAPLGEDHALKLNVRLGQKRPFSKNTLDYYKSKNICSSDL
jgi:hypothetical protein